MKRLLTIALVAAATLAAFTACDKGGGDNPPAPVKPVITISTQPTAPAAPLAEGAIGADAKLTVAASATEGATLSYQWYTNTGANNTGGTAIGGATAASYTLPATLTEGTYYYFCEVKATGADSKRTSAVTVTVAAGGENPDPSFTAVTAITGVPTAGVAGTDLPLTGTVEPTGATNKTIVWTVKEAGATGATIADGKLKTTAAGTVTVTATIANGATATTDYTKDFTITVTETDHTYTIGASPLASFGTLEESYAQPAAQLVTVTNTGTGAVTLTQPEAANYDVGTLSATDLAPGAKAMFTVRPKADLPVGTYNETITVSGTNGAKAELAARFTVAEPAPTYIIEAAPAMLDFGLVETGYAQPAAQNVTITNTGTGTASVTLLPTAANYDIEIVPAPEPTFSVRPRAGLAAGAYNETITVNGTNGATATVEARFTVRSSAVPAITMTTAAGSTSISMAGSGTATIDWGDGSAPQTVTLSGSLSSSNHTFSGAGTHTVAVYGGNITGLRGGGILTALDVTGCPALEYLDCRNQQLTALDVSKNTALKELNCTNNQLTALDVSKNTALETLGCSNNLLTALDLSSNTALKDLRCTLNKFTAGGLNALFGTLHAGAVSGGKLLNVFGNPGTASCDLSIATAKGWTVLN